MTLKQQKNLKIKKRRKKNRRRKNKKIWLNPIYIDNNLGSDEYEFIDKIKLEKEVLGDFEK